MESMEAVPTKRVVAVMFPLPLVERKLLANIFDDGWEFDDARKVERPAAVLLRPCSSQTIAAVRRRFPDARIVVVETPLYGGSYLASPDEKALEVGADLYLVEGGSLAA